MASKLLYLSLILTIFASSVLATLPVGQSVDQQQQSEEDDDFQILETDEKIVIVKDEDTPASPPAANPKPIVEKIDLKPLLLKKLGLSHYKFGSYPEHGAKFGFYPGFGAFSLSEYNSVYPGFGAFPSHNALYPGLRPVGAHYPRTLALPFVSNYPFGLYGRIPPRHFAGFIPRYGPVINDELITINVNIPEAKCEEKVAQATKKQDKVIIHKQASEGGHHHKEASKAISTGQQTGSSGKGQQTKTTKHHTKSTDKEQQHKEASEKIHQKKGSGAKGHHQKKGSSKKHQKKAHEKGSHQQFQKKPETSSSSSSSKHGKEQASSQSTSSGTKFQHSSQHSTDNQYKPKPVPTTTKTTTTTTTKAPTTTTKAPTTTTKRPTPVYHPAKNVNIKKDSESKKTTKENEENSQVNFVHEKKSGNGKNEESNSLFTDQNGKSMSSEEYNKKHFQANQKIH